MRRPIGDVLDAYANAVGAAEGHLLELDGFLDAPEVRGLARMIAGHLGRLNARGADKHLLLLGPASLAMLVGAAANATGPTKVPFWNGSSYVSPILIGA